MRAVGTGLADTATPGGRAAGVRSFQHALRGLLRRALRPTPADAAAPGLAAPGFVPPGLVGSGHGGPDSAAPAPPAVPGVVLGGLSTGRFGNALRRHPRLVDGTLALAIGATQFTTALYYTDRRWLAVLLHIAVVLPLVWRRRFPMGAFLACSAVAFLQWVARTPTGGDIGLLVALYTVATRRSRWRNTVAAVIITVGNALIAIAPVQEPAQTRLAVFVFLSALAITAGVLGNNVGTRRAYLAALADRAARLERERDQQAQIAAAAERARIAREMHDVVAHNLSVMIALADGAEFALRRSPEQAAQAISAVSSTGREALAEMRRLLGVLREEGSSDGTAPQPGLHDIDELVEQVRRAGLPVTLRTSGSPPDLRPGVQLAIFRLVQEALTNTLKHGGPDATATVVLSYPDDPSTGDIVDVEVTDTGRGPAAGPPSSSGQGLVGMRERMAIHGGTVTAGPAPGGGWRVHARVSAAGRPLTTDDPVGSRGRTTNQQPI